MEGGKIARNRGGWGFPSERSAGCGLSGGVSRLFSLVDVASAGLVSALAFLLDGMVMYLRRGVVVHALRLLVVRMMPAPRVVCTYQKYRLYFAPTAAVLTTQPFTTRTGKICLYCIVHTLLHFTPLTHCLYCPRLLPNPPNLHPHPLIPPSLHYLKRPYI